MIIIVIIIFNNNNNDINNNNIYNNYNYNNNNKLFAPILKKNLVSPSISSLIPFTPSPCSITNNNILLLIQYNS